MSGFRGLTDGEVELSHFELANSKLRACGDGNDASPGSSWSPWKALLPALVVSVLVHGLLLFGLRVPRAAPASRPVLVVTLRTASALQPARAPEPASAPQPLPAPPPPSPRDAPAAAVTSAAAPPRQVPAPAPTPTPAPAPARRDTAIAAPEEQAQAPVPQGVPDVREIAPQLVGRRLQVTVWVDPDGSVQKATVTPNELTPEQVALLEQAIAQVRFTPARLQDRPTAAILRTLLCFDDAGHLDVSSSDCWKPQMMQGR